MTKYELSQAFLLNSLSSGPKYTYKETLVYISAYNVHLQTVFAIFADEIRTSKAKEFRTPLNISESLNILTYLFHIE